MTALTTDAVTSYNGHNFSVMQEITSLQLRQIYDSAGRTVTHKVVTITVHDYVQADTGIGNTLDRIRQQLEQCGGALTVSNVGFGTFNLNGVITDLKWGPKPEILNWKSKGSGNAAEIVWQVSAAIMEGVAHQNGQIMEFCYDLSYRHDKSGYCTRTYNGHVIIAQTRNNINARTVARTADEYRDKVVPPELKNFRRLPGDYKLSEDKCRLDFTVTDEEIGPNFPPPGCIDAKASHTIEGDGPAYRSYTGTIDAEYELEKDVPRKAAVQMFANLVGDRVGIGRPQIKGGANRGAQAIIPARLTMREPEIYGKNIAAFSLQYTYTTEIQNIIGASGLWRPVPNNDWQKWSKSIQLATRPHGFEGLDTAGDIIVDIRGNQNLGLPKDKRVPGRAGANFNDIQGSIFGAMGFNPADITPEKSWIDYRLNAGIQVESQLAVLKTLGTVAGIVAPSIANGALGGLTGVIGTKNIDDLAGYGYGALGAFGATRIQNRAKPSIWITLTGMALRAVYDIPRPKLTLKGATAVEDGRKGYGFWTGVVANWGVDIIGAKWKLLFVIAGNEQAAKYARQPNILLNSVS